APVHPICPAKRSALLLFVTSARFSARAQVRTLRCGRPERSAGGNEPGKSNVPAIRFRRLTLRSATGDGAARSPYLFHFQNLRRLFRAAEVELRLVAGLFAHV